MLHYLEQEARKAREPQSATIIENVSRRQFVGGVLKDIAVFLAGPKKMRRRFRHRTRRLCGFAQQFRERLRVAVVASFDGFVAHFQNLETSRIAVGSPFSSRKVICSSATFTHSRKVLKAAAMAERRLGLRSGIRIRLAWA